jgi:predicted deacylase
LDLARVCPGDPDGSVTLRTGHALSALIRAADYYIDLHTGGRIMDVMPMSGYCLHPDPKILEAQRAMSRAFNLPFIWGTCPNLDGRSLSIARDANVPAIYTEYYGAGCDPQGVTDYVDGCLNVMGYLGMIDRPAPPVRIEHVVEDERDSAGFMQIQNLSPIEGFFEPLVSLGQRVEPGDPLGTVCDVLGDRVETVRSTQSGVVLTLRSLSRVDADETLGVIVEVDRPLGG